LYQLAVSTLCISGYLAQLAQLTPVNVQDGVDVVDAGADGSAQIARFFSHGS
jgi:hypothetical protein